MDIFFRTEPTYIVFYLITVLWIGEFIVFPSSHKSWDFSERKSFKNILLGLVASIALTLVLSYFRIYSVEGVLGKVMQYIGVTIYVLGVVLRYISVIYLGEYFTRDVQIEKEQELVSRGPYRVMRHPLYLGLFMLATGVPLFFRNPISLLFTIITVGKLINSRMISEEQSMEAVIGEEYRVWKSRRYRFIPYIY